MDVYRMTITVRGKVTDIVETNDEMKIGWHAHNAILNALNCPDTGIELGDVQIDIQWISQQED